MLLKLFGQHNAEFANKVGHNRAQGNAVKTIKSAVHAEL